MIGLPIIATDCRGNRDIASKTVKIDDYRELYNEIRQCMKNNKPYFCKKCDEYKLSNVLIRMEKIYIAIEWEKI